jgi:hypothetical protein
MWALKRMGITLFLNVFSSIDLVPLQGAARFGPVPGVETPG